MGCTIASLAFRQPAWLWGLAVLALVVILHLLRLHVRTVPCAAFDLWLEAVRGTPALSRWALLGLDLRLVMTLVLMGLIVVTLAGPLWISAAPGGHVALLFDTGAGMAFRDPSAAGTRLDRAADEARRVLDALPTSVRVRLLTVGGGVEPLGGPGPISIDRARSTLDDLPEPTERMVPVDALRSAARSLAEASHTQVLVFTDRAIDFDDLPPSQPPPHIVRIASPADNAGIVTLAADPLHDRVLAAVAAIGRATPTSVELAIERSGGEVDRLVAPLRFDPKRREAVADFETPLGGVRALRARLMRDADDADDLPLDDRAAIRRTADDAIRVVLVGDVGRRVRQALEAIPGVRVRRGDGPAPADEMVIYGGTLPRTDAALPPVVVLVELPGTWRVFEPRRLVPVREVPQFLLPNDDSEDGGFGYDPRGESLRVRQIVGAGAGIEPVIGRGESIAVARTRDASRRVWFVGLDVDDRAPWTRSADFPLFWAALVDDARAVTNRTGRFEKAAGVLSREVTMSRGEPTPFDPASIRTETLMQRRSLAPWSLVAAGFVVAGMWLAGRREEGTV